MQTLNEIDQLVKLISKLPGLGPKSAKRIILKLISNRDSILKPMIKALKNADINSESLVKIRNSKSSETVFHLYTNLNTDIQLKKIKAWNLDFFDKISFKDRYIAIKVLPVPAIPWRHKFLFL